MPSEHIIDPLNTVVFSRGFGVFTKEDYIEHMHRVKADPKFRSHYRQIVDCRDITQMALSSEQIREVATSSIFDRGVQRAFVADSDIHFGLSRMLASQQDMEQGHVISVFRSYQEALHWLGLPTHLDPFGSQKSKSDQA